MKEENARLWQRLCRVADREFKDLISTVPEEVRSRVKGLPVTYEPYPSREMEEDGIAPDTLGLFVGDAVDGPLDASQNLPSQVLLFLLNIWEDVGHDSEEYRREVRRTLLHEWGHYLGLEEDELVERELD